jgi:heme A synthase
VSELHKYIGYAVVAVFAVGWIWGFAAWITKRGPGERFWTWLTVAQVVAGIQAVIGIILLLLGKRPSTWLHYVYGFGPFLILAIAHALARDLQKTKTGAPPIAAWVPFALASFICFGLTLRGLMTGLGIG